MIAAGRHHPFTILLDLFGLGSIGGLLVAVHLLVPDPLGVEFAFDHTLSEPLSMVTSTYLHSDDAHLASNLLGFGIAASYAYAICLWSDERRWFWLTTLAFLTVLPVAVSVASLFVWDAFAPVAVLPPSRGFSAVAAGYGGFLAVALLVALRGRYSRRAVTNVGLLVLLVLLAELLVIYSESFPRLGLGVGLVGALVALSDLARSGYAAGAPDGLRAWAELVGVVLGAVLVVAVLTLLVYSLFPARVVDGGTITNVVAHLLGFLFGAVISAWGYRYWGTSLVR